MTYAVKASDLATMSEDERSVVLSELTDSVTGARNDQAAVMDARIRAFEARYEMSSVELLRRLASGEFVETADVSRWLFWLRARDSK